MAKRMKFSNDMRDYFQMTTQFERKSRKFATTSTVYNVEITPFPENMIEEPLTFCQELFDRIVDELKERSDVKADDMIRVTVGHPRLDMPICCPFMRAETLTGENIVEEIERVIQSNTDCNISDGDMSVEFTHTVLPSGSGKVKQAEYDNTESMRKNKKSIVRIQNASDSACLTRSIVVGMCHVHRSDTPEWKKEWRAIRAFNSSLQKTRAEELLKEVCLRGDKSCGPCEYKLIQDAIYPEYVVKVHGQSPAEFNLFRAPPLTQESKVIHVYYHDSHYDYISSITGFLGRSCYCENCDIFYNSREDHSCPKACQGCYDPKPCPFGEPEFCTICLRGFASQQCFAKHRQVKRTKSICDLVRACKTCGEKVIARKSKTHTCPGEKKCKICKKVVGSRHKCFIQPFEPAERNGCKFIFFDFECDQSQNGVHVPYYCVAHRVCDVCINTPINEHCENCQDREFIFEGEDTLEKFCTWLFKKRNKGYTAISHNFSNYDGQFVLRYLIEKTSVPPKQLLMNGNSIVTMTCRGVRFIDSLKFLDMKLADLPQTFGLTEMKKGYFPYLFNFKRYWDYDGVYPRSEYFLPNRMKPDDRLEFMNWYEQKVKSKATFNFKKEINEYCRSDVDILRRACGKFRSMFMQICKFDPFEESITMSQACAKIWRKDFMPPETVAIIPSQGYVNEKKYSIKGIRWIQSIAMTTGSRIMHALNGGEQKVAGMFVDGFDPVNKTVYEMLGCLFHGCLSCYTDRQMKNPFSLFSMDYLYKETFKKIEKLKKKNFKVVHIWEHDFDKRCKEDAVYKSLIDSLHPNREPLRPVTPCTGDVQMP